MLNKAADDVRTKKIFFIWLDEYAKNVQKLMLHRLIIIILNFAFGINPTQIKLVYWWQIVCKQLTYVRFKFYCIILIQKSILSLFSLAYQIKERMSIDGSSCLFEKSFSFVYGISISKSKSFFIWNKIQI